MSQTYALILHGGAGVLADHDYSAEREHMRHLAERAEGRLAAGDHAMDIVCDVIADLEASGLYVAGKGASPNRAGRYELDAAIMHGPTRKAGSIAALTGFVSPIGVARAVMDDTPHVMLAGHGACEFASLKDFQRVESVNDYYTPAAAPDDREIPTGTVGCVALDIHGELVAGTSTGGTLNKMEGRVGDCPIIGAGTWADDRVAVSCTGQGEFFLRTATAHDLAARVAYGGLSLGDATDAALKAVGGLGGEGGIIAVDRAGNVAHPFNSPGMKRAVVQAGKPVIIAVN